MNYYEDGRGWSRGTYLSRSSALGYGLLVSAQSPVLKPKNSMLFHFTRVFKVIFSSRIKKYVLFIGTDSLSTNRVLGHHVCLKQHGLALRMDSSGFCIQGITVDPEPAPVGWTEESLVKLEILRGMEPIRVDRFDCRLLLDPVELGTLLSNHPTEEDYPSIHDEEEKGLNDLRYEDLYEEKPHDGLVHEAPDARGNGPGRVAPPPPCAPVIVKQTVEPLHPQGVPCSGPCSLREIAVIRATALYVAKQSAVGASDMGQQDVCDSLKDVSGLEFLNSEHVHHCIFVDMLSQACTNIKDDRRKVEILEALCEYDDGNNDNDKEDVDAPLLTKIVCCMFDKVQSKAAARSIVEKIELGYTWINFSTCNRYGDLINRLKRKIHQKIEERSVEEPNEICNIDNGYPFDEGDGVTIYADKSTRASRLLKAQMMMKKRKVEHGEKSKAIREQTVQEDTSMRQRQIAQITHHRNMFQDSDDD